MMMTWLSTAMLALFATCALARETGPGVAVTVANAGTVTMRAVTVRLTGKSYAMGDLAPGASKSVAVHTAADSHIVLVYDGSRRLTIDCYMERGYSGKIAATVTSERVVAVKDDIISSTYQPIL
jgi:hypothetical protein